MNVTCCQAGSLGITPGFASNLCVDLGRWFPTLGFSCSTTPTHAKATVGSFHYKLQPYLHTLG